MIVLKKLGNYLWLGLMLLIILSGIIVAAGRLASPFLQEFKGDIEREASKLTDREIRIGNIQARWRGFGPKLVLKNLEINNPSKHSPPLVLKQVDLDLSLKSILYKGEFLPWNITLHGLKLELFLDKSGDFHVMGISSTGNQANTSHSLDPLLKLRRIELIDTFIQWTDLTKKTPDTRFESINLLLRNDDRRHQIDLSFTLPAKKDPITGAQTNKNQSVIIAADIRAQQQKLRKISGEFYLKTHQLDAGSWLKSLFPEPLTINSADLTTETWASVEQGQLVALEGTAKLKRVSVKNPQNDKSFDLTETSARFKWLKNEIHQQLRVEDLQFNTADNVWPESRLSYIRRQDKDAYFSIDHVNADIWQELQNFGIAEIFPQVPDIAVSGQLKDLQASWQPDFSKWAAKGDLQDISIKLPARPVGPHAAILAQLPSIENLSANFLVSDKSGRINLKTSNARLDFHQVFREPLDIMQMHGNLFWVKDDSNTLRLFTDYLELDTPDLTTWSRLDINIPANGKTYINMQTDFRDGNGSSTPKYLPYSIMNEELISWLDRAIVSGEVTSGSFVFKGPVDEFAFSKTHTGHFEVLFNVENLILDYLEDWPRLEEVAAQVRFHNNSLTIDLDSAKYLDSEITSARAHIDSLDPTSPLQIKGNAAGPASDSIRLLTESPLKEQFAKLKDSLVLKGRNKIDLDFQVPLESGRGEYRLNGRIHFLDNTLFLPDWGQQFEALRGRLKFDLEGLESDSLSASLLGSRADVLIGHEKDLTHIETKIKLNSKQISELFTHLPQNILAGETKWQVKLSIPPLTDHKKHATLAVKSNLAGMAIQAPEPLNKAMSKAAPLNVNVDLLANQTLPVAFTFDEKLHGKLKLVTDKKAAGLKSARIHFGKKAPGYFSQQHDEYRVSGKLAKLDLAPWLEWPALAGSQQQGVAAPVDIDLDIAQLNYRLLELNTLRLKAKKLNNTLNGEIKSKEMQGKFNIPQLKPLGRLNIDLNQLELSLHQGEEAKTDNNKVSLEPSEIPSIDLDIEKLIINKENFGKLVFQTTSKDNQVILDQIKLDGSMLKLEGDGSWQSTLTRHNNKDHQSNSDITNEHEANEHETNEHETRINFKLNSDDFGKVLKVLGFTPQIDKGKAEFDSSINWLDNPLNFDKPTLSGTLSMNIKEGRFLDLEPGVGRILGILNIGALQRRLTLDFSDLFKEGFSFDLISANFDLLFGDAYTSDLLINSPSATINLEGRTGLAKEDYDQKVTITPSLQSTITIAGAVAGGPAGAAIAYIAQKLVGKEVDKMARTRYTITGPWDNPTVTKQNTKKLDDTSQTDSLLNQ